MSNEFNEIITMLNQYEMILKKGNQEMLDFKDIDAKIKNYFASEMEAKKLLQAGIVKEKMQQIIDLMNSEMQEITDTILNNRLSWEKQKKYHNIQE